ncbi:MAG: hypothetical protein M8357_00200 [Desulfobulbaceae bacterium]|nr:hypothetical protein [Desulfobulbaceae bacterium]
MFLDSWSIALVTCGLVVLFLMIFAARSAVRVLFYWDPDSDSNRQIRLENEIWLTSTLVEYALAVQVISLVVFVLAADHYSQSIVGAMCATGSLLANDFGIPALIVKIGGVFFYGFWIVLHQLDVRSERYPLVRIKYVYLLLLLPLLLLDLSLETLYIAGLEPDIITSCCAVVFGESAGGGTNLLAGMSHEAGLILFYGTSLLLIIFGLSASLRWRPWGILVYSAAWFFFFLLALMMVTTEFSSYIYAMPFHNCPFCILKPEYNYIGFIIYLTLFAGAFLGMSMVVVEPLRRLQGMEKDVSGYQRKALYISLLLLALFIVLASYHYVKYMYLGGEG